MSDTESVSTTSMVDKPTTVTESKGKPSVKKFANGGKPWTPEQVSFRV